MQSRGLAIRYNSAGYVPLAAARGVRVIVEVQQPLVRLMCDVPGVDLILGRGAELPAFDLHCPMLSLPLALTTPIPPPPRFLTADPVNADLWRSRLAVTGQALRIGLAWAGSPSNLADSRRSIAPARLAPLFALPGLRFVSLQHDGPKPPPDLPLIDFMDEMTDFADTAAQIVNLDLVIAVDTAVAHLAASLGKPVWLLDRFDACWRWFEARVTARGIRACVCIASRSPVTGLPFWRRSRTICTASPRAVFDSGCVTFCQSLAGKQRSPGGRLQSMNRKQRRAQMPTGKVARQTSAVPAMFAAALQHHQAGRTQQAERLYRQCLTVNPRHADSLHLLGVVAHTEGRHAQAVDLIGKAIAIDGSAAPYHSNLGTALWKLDRLEDAVASYRRALELRPDYAQALFNLATVLWKQQRLSEAETCFRSALAVNPDYAATWDNLGTVLKTAGRYDEAIAATAAPSRSARTLPNRTTIWALRCWNTGGRRMRSAATARRSASGRTTRRHTSISARRSGNWAGPTRQSPATEPPSRCGRTTPTPCSTSALH